MLLFNIRLVRCSQPSAAASGIAHVGITRRSPHPSSLTLLKRRVEQRSREARRDRQDGIVWLPGERIPTGQWRSSEVRHARESYRNVSKGDILRRRSQPSSMLGKVLFERKSPQSTTPENKRMGKSSTDVADTSFLSCSDITYVSTIELGGQTMQVILDTGSSDLWVFSSQCNNCPPNVNKYDHSASTTYKHNGQSFSIGYADGDTVSGYLSKDVLTWAGLSISKQTFAEIDSAEDFRISCVEDGLLGMAFDEIASSGAATPFHNLITKELVEKPRFSFFLGHDDGDGGNGVLTLGGSNPNYFSGDMRWISLAQRAEKVWYPYYFGDADDYWATQKTYSGFWEIDLHHAQSGESSLTTSNTAVLDTGTTLLIGPSADVQIILDNSGADCWFLDTDTNERLYVRPCSEQDPKWEFWFGIVSCDAPDASNLHFYFGSDGSEDDKFTLAGSQQVIQPSPCPEGEFMDCAGLCLEDSYRNWLHDGHCDDGRYGYFFNCPEFDCDKGDCHSSHCTMGDPGTMCMMGIEPDFYGSDSWILGDVFLRAIYSTYDYTHHKVGLAYAITDNPPSPEPTTKQPIPTPIPQLEPTNSPSTSTPSLSPTQLPSQAVALSRLYSETSGPSWSIKRNWGNDHFQYPCHSYGVLCDLQFESVVSLNLDRNNLDGTIPSQIGLLTKLTDIGLRSNKFRGIIPTEVGMLKDLGFSFLVHQNQISGSLPSEVGRLGNVQTVELGYNSLSKGIPTQIGKLVGLQSLLDLSTNAFTSTLPTELGRLHGLTGIFRASSNTISGVLPTELGELSRVALSLALASNQICAEIPSEISSIWDSETIGNEIAAGNAIGTPCCEFLPGSFTCDPTPVPSQGSPSLVFPSAGPTLHATLQPSQSDITTPSPSGAYNFICVLHASLELKNVQSNIMVEEERDLFITSMAEVLEIEYDEVIFEDSKHQRLLSQDSQQWTSCIVIFSVLSAVKGQDSPLDTFKIMSEKLDHAVSTGAFGILFVQNAEIKNVSSMKNAVVPRNVTISEDFDITVISRAPTPIPSFNEASVIDASKIAGMTSYALFFLCASILCCVIGIAVIIYKHKNRKCWKPFNTFRRIDKVEDESEIDVSVENPIHGDEEEDTGIDRVQEGFVNSSSSEVSSPSFNVKESHPKIDASSSSDKDTIGNSDAYNKSENSLTLVQQWKSSSLYLIFRRAVGRSSRFLLPQNDTDAGLCKPPELPLPVHRGIAIPIEYDDENDDISGVTEEQL